MSQDKLSHETKVATGFNVNFVRCDNKVLVIKTRYTVHTCIHAYIHTYMHACIHAYIHTYTYMHAYIHACIHTYMHACIHTYMHACIHVIFVTWARVVCLICTSEARGLRVYVSGKPRVCMLQLICTTLSIVANINL